MQPSRAAYAWRSAFDYSAGEGREDTVAELDLFLDGKRSVPEDALVELTGPAGSAAPVRDRKVVEDEQFTRTHANLDPYGVKAQPSLLEESQFVIKGGELGTAQKPRLRLDGRQDGCLPKGGFDDPREATLDIPGSVIPSAMADAVCSEPADQLMTVRPWSAAQQRAQRHESCDRVTWQRVPRDVQRGVPGHIGRHDGSEWQAEVEVQSLKVATWRPIRWRDHKVADELEAGIGRRSVVDDHSGCTEGVVWAREGTKDPNDPHRAEAADAFADRYGLHQGARYARGAPRATPTALNRHRCCRAR